MVTQCEISLDLKQWGSAVFAATSTPPAGHLAWLGGCGLWLTFYQSVNSTFSVFLLFVTCLLMRTKELKKTHKKKKKRGNKQKKQKRGQKDW